ncbi:hypothetical protein BKA82DRAFT_2833265 [Pisolithus tinctorius]|nr:hypothetical protein BKA82DRAFT_2833265 [Pisolithus tinctorius]
MSSGDINDQAPGGFRRPSSRHHPFHFHTQPYPHDPQPRPWAPAHQNPSSASTAPSPSLPAMPSDTLPLFSPNPLTSYPHPLGAWNATFPPTAQHPPPVPTQTHTQPQAFDGGTDDVYYPTGYNTGTFPFVPPLHPVQGQALHHSYPHAYMQTRHQIAPSPLRRVQLHRRDPYTALSQMQENQGNESPASQPQQPQQQQHQRTDPEQSKTQLIIHQRTQELLAQATLSSTSSLDCQATTGNRPDSGSGGAAMQSVGEHRPGSSSTVQQGPGHVGIPFLFGSVEEALYGVPSSSIGQVMGKPNTGAGTGTTSHLRDMDTTRVSQVPISASERQGQTRVSEPRDPSTHPPSPPGGFVGCTPLGDMQAPLMSEGGEHSPEPNKDAVYSSSMHAIRSSVRDLPERVLLIRSVSRSERAQVQVRKARSRYIQILMLNHRARIRIRMTYTPTRRAHMRIPTSRRIHRISIRVHIVHIPLRLMRVIQRRDLRSIIRLVGILPQVLRLVSILPRRLPRTNIPPLAGISQMHLWWRTITLQDLQYPLWTK